MVRMHVIVLAGQLREVTKASLQKPPGNQILTVDEMYAFCSENLTQIKYILVKKEEVILYSKDLEQEFVSCQRIVGRRSFHKFIIISEGIMRCYSVSNINTFEEQSVLKIAPLTLKEKILLPLFTMSVDGLMKW